MRERRSSLGFSERKQVGCLSVAICASQSKIPADILTRHSFHEKQKFLSSLAVLAMLDLDYRRNESLLSPRSPSMRDHV